jgi:hypothetical protein
MPANPNQTSDLSDLISEIEEILRVQLDEEEKRLLTEKKLLTVILEESAPASFTEKAATDLTSLFTTSFIQDFVPTLNTVITTD